MPTKDALTRALLIVLALSLTRPLPAGETPSPRDGAQPPAQSKAPAPTAWRKEAPDPREWHALLSGTWQFAPPGSADFSPAKVPGYWSSALQSRGVGWQDALKLKSGTYRRNFQVPKAAAGAVLDFEAICWGGEVFVNGRPVGKHDLAFSPVSFDISGAVKPGANRLTVKPRGWTALDRYNGQDVQIPVAAANWWGNKCGGIPGDVHVRSYVGARVGRLRIVPRIDGPACDLTARVTAGPRAWAGRLAAQVLSDGGDKALSPVTRADVRLRPGEARDVKVATIAVPSARLWWPESPTLYRMVVWLVSGGDNQVASVRADTFGFREVAVKDGRFHLNNRPIALFGATRGLGLRQLEMLLTRRKLWDDLEVRLFRKMNGVAYRTHMTPIPRRCLDACDRAGFLLLPEFPNFPDVQCKGDESPYDLPLYWKNLQREIRGIVADRFNHPSIIGWSASNEGNGFGDWERKHLVPFVKSVDPTRLVMLSADVTPDVADQHNFAGMWWGTHTDYEVAAGKLAEAYPNAIIGNTEYGQFGSSKAWYGNRKPEPAEVQTDKALLLMEQTEALRRARFDVIMPYGTPFGRAHRMSGRDEDLSPGFHALRNALSPLAVSLDFSRRHARAGAPVKVPVWVMSDSEAAKGAVAVEVYLLDRHPGYDWDGELKGLKVLSKGAFSASITPWQARRELVTLPAPNRGGAFTLAAVLRKKAEDKATAVSLRPLQVYRPLPPVKRKRTVGVIEKGGRLTAWLESRGHRVILPYGGARPDVIIIGEGRLYDTRLTQYGFSVANRVGVGGARLVVLEQGAWDAKMMQENMGRALDRVVAAPLQAAASALFPEPGTTKAVGSYRDYRRLNGVDHVGLRVCLLPSGTVASGQGPGGAKLTGKAAERSEAPAAEANPWRPLICAFGRGGGKVDWALAHRRFGKGEVLACQIPLARRLDPTRETEFDPVAERLMAFLVEGDLPPISRKVE